jgi:dihydrofolate reductase
MSAGTAPAAAGTGPYEALPPSAGLSAIVAVGRDGAIGRHNALAWHIPEELAHFRRVTKGHTLIMGSSTWASIGRPLPGRRIIVLSSRYLDLPDTVEVAADLDDALAQAMPHDPSPIIAGGAAVYTASLPRVRRLWWTDVDVDVPDGDVFFPQLDLHEWDEVASWFGEDVRLTFRVFDRRSRPGAEGTGNGARHESP